MKRFLCPVYECRKRYSDPSSLRKHIKALHGENAYILFRELKNSVRIWEKSFRIQNDVAGVPHIVSVNGDSVNFDEAASHANKMSDTDIASQSYSDSPDDYLPDGPQEKPCHLRRFVYQIPPYFLYPMPPFWPYPFVPGMSGLPGMSSMPHFPQIPSFFFNGLENPNIMPDEPIETPSPTFSPIPTDRKSQEIEIKEKDTEDCIPKEDE